MAVVPHNACSKPQLKKKIRSITLIIWGKGGLKKMPKISCFVSNKYQVVTHVSKVFKIIVRSVALVTKKIWAILEFLYGPDFLQPCTRYPMH